MLVYLCATYIQTPKNPFICISFSLIFQFLLFLVALLSLSPLFPGSCCFFLLLVSFLFVLLKMDGTRSLGRGSSAVNRVSGGFSLHD